MSGQPYRYATDPQKFRQEYMNTLGIQADVDTMNLDANKVYKQTGQLPAVSQMQDNRTTAEIYADVQKLKLNIIKDLAPIADTQFASNIVETLNNSPLNSNNKLIIFLSQRAPEIANNLKKLYSYKIKGDINDANVFVHFIEDMYNKSKTSFSSVESYFNKTGTEIESGINKNDINKIKEIINRMKVRINNLPINKMSPYNRQAYNQVIKDLLDNIDLIVRVFPSTEEMLRYDSYGLQVTEKIPIDDSFTNHVRELHTILKEELPRTDTLQTAILHLEKFIENTNPAEFMDAYNRVLSLLPGRETINMVKQIREYLNKDLNILIRTGELKQIENVNVPVTMNQRASDTIFTNVMGYNPPDRPEPVEGVEGQGFNLTKRKRGRPKGTGLKKQFKEYVNENSDKIKGIQPEKRYISFGKYLINNNKLNDNIISIKRPSGANIIEIPSSRVSNNLANVFKKIVGGKIPTFNELSDLTEEEKLYLHKVAKKSEIEDKFSIPAPSKDKQDKDIHNFEVMKGEIMSGNDSKELIKNFKLLLIKLSKNRTLPKNQVQEIMHELLELGY